MCRVPILFLNFFLKFNYLTILIFTLLLLPAQKLEEYMDSENFLLRYSVLVTLSFK